MKDNIEEWQDINVDEIYIDPQYNIDPKSAKWYYEKLHEITVSYNYNMLTFDELDMVTQNILKNTFIKAPILNSDSLWNEWNKLCELCLLHIYINNDGKAICKYNIGN